MESILINTLIMFSVINQQQHVCAVKRDTSFFTAYFQQQLKKTDISLKTAPSRVAAGRFYKTGVWTLPRMQRCST